VFPVAAAAQAPAPVDAKAPKAAASTPVATPRLAYPPPPPRWADQPPIDYPFPQPVATANQVSAGTPVSSGSEVSPGTQVSSGFPYGPPPPPPDGVSRRFSLTAAIGPGALIGPGESALALSYQVARIGIGIDRDLILQLSYEGAGTSSVNPMTQGDSWLKQDMMAAGLQHFLGQRLYLRGGLGVGFVSEKTKTMKFTGGKGIAALAAFGYELTQRTHWALGIDLHASLTHYPAESWKTFGLSATISVF
jgi:hypothetical protein